MKLPFEMVMSSSGDSDLSSQNNPDPDEGDINVPDIPDPEEDSVEEINSALDQLNSALDVLEEKNENIRNMLLALLKDSREARKELAAMAESDPADGQEAQQ